VRRCVRCGKCCSRRYRCSICQTEAQITYVIKPSIVESLHFAILFRQLKHKNYDDVTCTSSSQLISRQPSSGWGRNETVIPQPVADDCNWLKRFTVRAFCFGWNTTVSNGFWNCFNFSLFRFHFVLRTALQGFCLCALITATSENFDKNHSLVAYSILLLWRMVNQSINIGWFIQRSL